MKRAFLNSDRKADLVKSLQIIVSRSMRDVLEYTGDIESWSKYSGAYKSLFKDLLWLSEETGSPKIDELSFSIINTGVASLKSMSYSKALRFAIASVAKTREDNSFLIDKIPDILNLENIRLQRKAFYILKKLYQIHLDFESTLLESLNIGGHLDILGLIVESNINSNNHDRNLSSINFISFLTFLREKHDYETRELCKGVYDKYGIFMEEPSIENIETPFLWEAVDKGLVISLRDFGRVLVNNMSPFMGRECSHEIHKGRKLSRYIKDLDASQKDFKKLQLEMLQTLGADVPLKRDIIKINEETHISVYNLVRDVTSCLHDYKIEVEEKPFRVPTYYANVRDIE